MDTIFDVVITTPGFLYQQVFSFSTALFALCFLNIQSVSRLVDITAGGDFLGLRDQKKFI